MLYLFLNEYCIYQCLEKSQTILIFKFVFNIKEYTTYLADIAVGATGLFLNGSDNLSSLGKESLRYMALIQRATDSSTYSDEKSDSRVYFILLKRL